jgi:RNA polymerase sigma-70 factor (ECF subfamily)
VAGDREAFRADARLSTWLVRIVINQALGPPAPGSAARSYRSKPAMESNDPDTRQALEDDPDRGPERTAMRTEMRRLIEVAHRPPARRVPPLSSCWRGDRGG